MKNKFVLLDICGYRGDDSPFDDPYSFAYKRPIAIHVDTIRMIRPLIVNGEETEFSEIILSEAEQVFVNERFQEFVSRLEINANV